MLLGAVRGLAAFLIDAMPPDRSIGLSAGTQWERGIGSP
jgi:hypothetical protein